ncbi:MAG: multiprotein-bridging factor 1 family protein [Syntrophobacteraceae bacterium]
MPTFLGVRLPFGWVPREELNRRRMHTRCSQAHWFSYRSRKKLKLHQRDMAHKMGISERVYRRYELREQVPGSDKLAALLNDLKELSSTWLTTGAGRMFKSSQQPELKEVIFDIVESNPSIQRILLMLKGLDGEDLESIFHQVSERKKLRDLHTELRSMVNKLERPRSEKVHEKEPI